MSRQARPKRPNLRTDQFAATSPKTETGRIADPIVTGNHDNAAGTTIAPAAAAN